MSGHIWITPDRRTAWIWKALAIHLAGKTGMRPVLIVASAEDRKFYAAQGGVEFPGDIVVRDDYYSELVEGRLDAMAPEVVFRCAREYEERHGISLMRSMLLADRHLGRGFIPGGAGYPRSYISDSSSIVSALRACLRSVAFWEQLADTRPPGLVISFGGGGGLVGKPYALLCRERGIPLRILFPFRFGDSFFWGRDEFGRFPELETTLENTPLATEIEIELVARELRPSGFATNIVFTSRIARDLSWSRIAYLVAKVPIQRFYWAVRGYRKGRIGAKPLAQMRNLMNARFNWNTLDRIALLDLSRLDTRRIVYFTLQQEPESSTLVMAPYATNQVAQLRELALSLPADTQLVVKEHIWALYGRPPGFYEQIAAIPNVTLVHPSVSSLELIRRADLVCVITSSAGYEAAVLGKPVIHLGHYSTLLGLPHVWHFESTRQFEKVRTILRDSSIPGAAEARARAGARYFIVARSLCMDLTSAKIHGRTELLSEEECEIFSRPLLATLEGQEPAPSMRATNHGEQYLQVCD